jgi:tRNA U34 5-methylaminomethyl-2-thiouridine-forming methyltransferase MnmC
MQTRLEITSDGSHTLFVPALNEHYHSTFGAVQESMTVFIQYGFDKTDEAIFPVHILEMGFGTGLNALLTLIKSEKSSRPVHYTGVEKFPLPFGIIEQLNYPQLLDTGSMEKFHSLHKAAWNQEIKITADFTLCKIENDLQEVLLNPYTFDLVYYDAFGPEVQPELWNDQIFRKIAMVMKPCGILVTYSAKGSVRRALKNVGLEVEKLPGPPGKREVTRAIKK